MRGATTVKVGDNEVKLSPKEYDILRVFYRSAGHRAAALQMTDSLGLLVVDEDLRVLKATAEAETLLAEGKQVGLNPLSQVRFSKPALQAAAGHLLKRGVAKTEYRDAGTRIHLIRVGETDASEFFAGPVLVVLLDHKTNAAAGLDELAARYRMTPAEARVFAAIAL